MSHRRSLAVAVAACALLLAACKGTPFADFNGGEPVSLPSWQFDAHQVLRLPDGSTLVSRMDTASFEPEVVKLAPDGTVDTSWGSAGSFTDVPFRPANMASGFSVGAVQPSGKVLLYGWLNQYMTGVVRVDVDGTLDTTYGSGGTLITDDAFAGTGIGPACHLAAAGTVHCAAVTRPTPGAHVLTLTDVDVDGAVAASRDVPLDLSSFVRPGPPDTTAALGTYPFAIDVAGADTRVAIQVGTTYRDEDDLVVGASEADTVVVAVDATGVDTTIADGGYQLLDLDGTPAGGIAEGTGGWNTFARQLDLAADGTVTLLAQVNDSFATGENRHAVVRLGADGTLDAAFGGTGFVQVTDAVGTPVGANELATRDGKAITVVGTIGTLPTSQGVVLRYLPDGTLDPAFSEDGVAEVPGAELATGLDVRNGKVTVGAASTTSPPEVDALVTVLYG